MKKILLFILLLCSLNLWATKYHVATTGNDISGNGSSSTPWATIPKAISSVFSPDTIYIHSGSYTVDYVIPPVGVDIIGQDSANTIINCTSTIQAPSPSSPGS